MCLLKSCPTSADQCLICLVLFHGWTTSPEFIIVWLFRQMIYKLSYNWNLCFKRRKILRILDWLDGVLWPDGLMVVFIYACYSVEKCPHNWRFRLLHPPTGWPVVPRSNPQSPHPGLKPTLQSLANHVAGGCAAISTLFSSFGIFHLWKQIFICVQNKTAGPNLIRFC